MNIDQSAFIQDWVIKENLVNCNANVVSMKAGSSIDMTRVDKYEEKDIHTY